MVHVNINTEKLAMPDVNRDELKANIGNRVENNPGKQAGTLPGQEGNGAEHLRDAQQENTPDTGSLSKRVEAIRGIINSIANQDGPVQPGGSDNPFPELRESVQQQEAEATVAAALACVGPEERNNVLDAIAERNLDEAIKGIEDCVRNHKDVARISNAIRALGEPGNAVPSS